MYAPNDPYFWEVDNIPITNLVRRENLINMALDNVIEEMRDAIGDQGSMANRLNQSLDQDGSLKTTAVDEALHSIEEHTDSEDYVRMTAAQAAKLDLVDDLATSLYLQVDIGSDEYEFKSGPVKFIPSSTVTFSLVESNQIQCNMAFPVDAAHRHFYNVTPVSVNLVTPDYINYQVDSYATPYVEDTLRVYVNGMRLNPDVAIYVPGYDDVNSWTLLSYTPDYENGTFAFSAAIAESDIVSIDYDILLTS
jgi:hypothetical protein